ncbi:MAG: PBP1A family penicillin-binding protein [Firmicutes bacterium]|nr:PBP1A family penicillin-binding protein [Bacillota bacterium]
MEKEPGPGHDAHSLSGVKSRSIKGRRILTIAAGLTLSVAAAVLAAVGIFFYTGLFFTSPEFSEKMFHLPAATTVYDHKGRTVAQLHGPQYRLPVTLDQVPAHTINAVLAAEDARFFNHPGFDGRAMVRAMIANLKAGRIEEGASTVTQQLVRNVFLTPEQVWERKFREIHMAFHLERQMEKEAILENYLNMVYFGDGVYGIEAAARHFFGKNSSRLGINESALLAGTICNPGAYNPFRHPERALQRRNAVLGKMVGQGWLKAGRCEILRSLPLVLQETGGSLKDRYPYPFFIDQVVEEAIRVHGVRAEDVYNGGLRIYTTLRPGIQSLAERIFADDALFPAGSGYRRIEAALAAVDPKTGFVLALAGGREYGSRRGFNRATMMKRSPGSALKPLAVYAPALEAGWSSKALLVDGPITISDYQPRNHDRRFRGKVTMNQAVAWSINVPAVWLLNQVGVSRGVETLKKLNLPLHKDDRNLSLALGGMTRGLSPLELAGGYAALANGGYRIRPRTIIQIYDRLNRPLVECSAPKPVFSKRTCRDMTRLLRAAVRFGTGKEAGLDVPVAGKTGTTEHIEDSGGNRDAWFVGYTPEVAAAVWMGYDRTDARHYLGFAGGSYPARIFRAFMSGALKELPGRESDLFAKPPVYPAPPPKPKPSPRPAPPPARENPSPVSADPENRAQPGPEDKTAGERGD